ncbi:MAG: hypothetical protein DMG30_13900 [Acidobacteria bacterium]|nr:MAG: hypothetical protein DMG30_13900 [Acidobacteriota bacterium]
MTGKLKMRKKTPAQHLAYSKRIEANEMLSEARKEALIRQSRSRIRVKKRPDRFRSREKDPFR